MGGRGQGGKDLAANAEIAIAEMRILFDIGQRQGKGSKVFRAHRQASSTLPAGV